MGTVSCISLALTYTFSVISSFSVCKLDLLRPKATYRRANELYSLDLLHKSIVIYASILQRKLPSYIHRLRSISLPHLGETMPESFCALLQLPVGPSNGVGRKWQFSPNGLHFMVVGNDPSGLVQDTVRLYVLLTKDIIELTKSRLTRSLAEEECQ
jgi:hypothetical protein